MALLERGLSDSPAIAAIRERLRNGGYTTTSRLAASARAHNGRPPPDPLAVTIRNIQRLRTGEPLPPRAPAVRLVVSNDRTR
jgi:hypothetical protein